MALQAESPELVRRLSKIMSDELAEKIAKIANESTDNVEEAEAMIVEGLNTLSSD